LRPFLATASRASFCVCSWPRRAVPPFSSVPGHGGPRLPLRPFLATAGRASFCVCSWPRRPAPLFASVSGHGGPRLFLHLLLATAGRASLCARSWPRRAALPFASGRVGQLVLTILRADCCTAADSHLVLGAGRVATSPVVLPRSVVHSACACGVSSYASVPAFHVLVVVAALRQQQTRQGLLVEAVARASPFATASS